MGPNAFCWVKLKPLYVDGQLDFLLTPRLVLILWCGTSLHGTASNTMIPWLEQPSFCKGTCICGLPNCCNYRKSLCLDLPRLALATGELWWACKRTINQQRTGSFDDCILLDSIDRQDLSLVLKFLYNNCTDQTDRLFGELSLSAYNTAIKSASIRLGLQQLRLTPHVLRHSGPSSDCYHKTRSIVEIQQRGRWLAASSVARYKKPGRMLLLHQKIPDAIWKQTTAARKKALTFFSWSIVRTNSAIYGLWDENLSWIWLIYFWFHQLMQTTFGRIDQSSLSMQPLGSLWFMLQKNKVCRVSIWAVYHEELWRWLSLRVFSWVVMDEAPWWHLTSQEFQLPTLGPPGMKIYPGFGSSIFDFTSWCKLRLVELINPLFQCNRWDRSDSCCRKTKCAEYPSGLYIMKSFGDAYIPIDIRMRLQVLCCRYIFCIQWCLISIRVWMSKVYSPDSINRFCVSKYPEHKIH